MSIVVFFFFNDTATTEIYTFPYTTLFRSVEEGALSRAPAACAGVAGALRWALGGGKAGSGPSVEADRDRKSTRLNSSHANISYAVFCLKKKKHDYTTYQIT